METRTEKTTTGGRSDRSHQAHESNRFALKGALWRNEHDSMDNESPLSKAHNRDVSKQHGRSAARWHGDSKWRWHASSPLAAWRGCCCCCCCCWWRGPSLPSYINGLAKEEKMEAWGNFIARSVFEEGGYFFLSFTSMKTNQKSIQSLRPLKGGCGDGGGGGGGGGGN